MEWIIAFVAMEAVAIPVAIRLEHKLGPKANYLDRVLMAKLFKRG